MQNSATGTSRSRLPSPHEVATGGDRGAVPRVAASRRTGLTVRALAPVDPRAPGSGGGIEADHEGLVVVVLDDEQGVDVAQRGGGVPAQPESRPSRTGRSPTTVPLMSGVKTPTLPK